MKSWLLFSCVCAGSLMGCASSPTAGTARIDEIIVPRVLPDWADRFPDARVSPSQELSLRKGQPFFAPIEVRGLWVTRWDFHSAGDVRRILQEAEQAGFNQVYFQVRGMADAFYRSRLEPWAAELSGVLGQDPGWDPLAVAVQEAHARGLELHAWINVASGWKGSQLPPASRPEHVLRTHPEWRAIDKSGKPAAMPDSYLFLNIGHPEYQEHVLQVVADLLGGYELDGLHLDYCRYPASATSYDATSNRLYEQARLGNAALRREDWQRAILTTFVGRLHSLVHELRPRAVLSAAVTGIYQDRWNWQKVVRGFDDFLQDSHAWAAAQAVDRLIPMIYWPPTQPPGGFTDFRTLVHDFAPLLSDVEVVAGVNVAAGSFSHLEQEIDIARQANLQGVVLFAYASFKKAGFGPRLKAGPFRESALPRLPVPGP